MKQKEYEVKTILPIPNNVTPLFNPPFPKIHKKKEQHTPISPVFPPKEIE